MFILCAREFFVKLICIVISDSLVQFCYIDRHVNFYILTFMQILVVCLFCGFVFIYVNFL